MRSANAGNVPQNDTRNGSNPNRRRRESDSGGKANCHRARRLTELGPQCQPSPDGRQHRPAPQNSLFVRLLLGPSGAGLLGNGDGTCRIWGSPTYHVVRENCAALAGSGNAAAVEYCKITALRSDTPTTHCRYRVLQSSSLAQAVALAVPERHGHPRLDSTNHRGRVTPGRPARLLGRA